MHQQISNDEKQTKTPETNFHSANPFGAAEQMGWAQRPISRSSVNVNDMRQDIVKSQRRR